MLGLFRVHVNGSLCWRTLQTIPPLYMCLCPLAGDVPLFPSAIAGLKAQGSTTNGPLAISAASLNYMCLLSLTTVFPSLVPSRCCLEVLGVTLLMFRLAKLSITNSVKQSISSINIVQVKEPQFSLCYLNHCSGKAPQLARS